MNKYLRQAPLPGKTHIPMKSKIKILFSELLQPFYVIMFCTAQSTFVVKIGKKAKYTLEIPQKFTAMKSIGANVGLKFADKNGARPLRSARA